MFLSDDAVVAAVQLSQRYISGRFLPDKAVDLLDTASARVMVGMSAKPGALEDIDRHIEHLDTAIAAIKRDQASAITQEEGDLTEMEAARDALWVEHETFEKRWNVPWREGFGMTETGADLMVPLEDTECVGTGAMGKPVSTKEAKVIDEDGKEVPDGAVGELVMRGEPMMLGYWNKPEATEAFFKDGWAHTGDLVYKDEKGFYHWVGRLKDMIRRTGENISSVEVEGVLMEHEKIALAAVVPVPDKLRGEEVKAYIVLKQGETADAVPPQEIVEFAKQKLAYFKVPRYIEYAEDLPRTPSERVEKHKLIAAKNDLRVGSYDAVDKIWR